MADSMARATGRDPLDASPSAAQAATETERLRPGEAPPGEMRPASAAPVPPAARQPGASARADRSLDAGREPGAGALPGGHEALARSARRPRDDRSARRGDRRLEDPDEAPAAAALRHGRHHHGRRARSGPVDGAGQAAHRGADRRPGLGANHQGLRGLQQHREGRRRAGRDRSDALRGADRLEPGADRGGERERRALGGARWGPPGSGSTARGRWSRRGWARRPIWTPRRAPTTSRSPTSRPPRRRWRSSGRCSAPPRRTSSTRASSRPSTGSSSAARSTPGRPWRRASRRRPSS